MEHFVLAIATSLMALCSANSLTYAQTAGGVIDVATIGEPPTPPINPPSGRVFRTRCPAAIDACAQIVPPVEHIGGNHHVACIRQAELA